jgi:thiamine pyrophosphokinase
VTHAIVLADGAAPTRAALDTAWPGWDSGVGYVVAADGGARHATALGLRLDLWVGDGDSIDPGDLAGLAAAGVRIERVPEEKDASDAELAILAATDAGADEITILGGLGGVRTDHALMNVALLEHAALGSLARGARMYDERAARLTWLHGGNRTPASASLQGHVDDLVTLVPFGGPVLGVTTSGLRYPLAAAVLAQGSSRGLSNLRTSPQASVSIQSGSLLVIETPVTVEP